MNSLSYGSISSPGTGPLRSSNAHSKQSIPESHDSVISWKQTNIPVLAVAFTAALATGAPTYAFGLYGATLKKTLHLSQTQLNIVSSANFCAGLLSWIPGLFVDKWGCKRGMIMGGLMQSLSLLGYWMAAQQFASSQTSSSVTVPVLSLLGVIVFMSTALVAASLFKVIVISCERGTRGTAVGIAKGYVGLGVGAYSCLFEALRTPTSSDLDFLPMTCALAILVIVIPAWLLLPGEQVVMEVARPLHFRMVYVGLMILAVLVVGTSAISIFEPQHRHATTTAVSDEDSSSTLRAIAILAAWLGPIGAMSFVPRKAPSLREMESFMSRSTSSLSDADNENEYSLFEMLSTTTAWLLCWTCTILVGSGTALANNMGQEVEALHLPAQIAPGCLSMFSAAQSMSRVATGALSECARDGSSWGGKDCGIQNSVPRPAFLILASVFGALGHLVLAIATTKGAFVLGVVVSGIAFGMVWPLMVLIVGEVFGTRNLGANYIFFGGFTSAIGTLCLSNFLASSVYESHINHDKNDDDDLMTCYGKGCFRATHITIAVLCCSCVASSVAILTKTRNTYAERRRPPSTTTLASHCFSASALDDR